MHFRSTELITEKQEKLKGETKKEWGKINYIYVYKKAEGLGADLGTRGDFMSR